jgi:hypothetical protein
MKLQKNQTLFSALLEIKNMYLIENETSRI